ncbi:MAG: DUF1659 domain-containing protein [Tissierellia bacterium]|nr:DUF1659 domain-containing protein [Tissierellia bacterium]
MAATIEKTQLRLEYDNGMKDGKQAIQARTYSNLKNNATDEGLKSASTAIGTLSKKDILNTKKIVTSKIE